MFWCNILIMIAMFFAVVAMIAFVLAIFCDFDGVLLMITLAATVLAIVFGFASSSTKKANTTVDVNVVQMEVTKCDMTSVRLSSGITQIDCYVTVGNKYMVEVTEEEYVELNVGDSVEVVIETKTVFGEVQNPTVSLKG